MKAEALNGSGSNELFIATFGDVLSPIFTSDRCNWFVYEFIGAIAQDQVLALFGTTADAFKSTDFYTYSTILTITAVCLLPTLISWSALVFGGNLMLWVGE